MRAPALSGCTHFFNYLCNLNQSVTPLHPRCSATNQSITLTRLTPLPALHPYPPCTLTRLRTSPRLPSCRRASNAAPLPRPTAYHTARRHALTISLPAYRHGKHTPHDSQNHAPTSPNVQSNMQNCAHKKMRQQNVAAFFRALKTDQSLVFSSITIISVSVRRANNFISSTVSAVETTAW